jgi:hypothetical protein
MRKKKFKHDDNYEDLLDDVFFEEKIHDDDDLDTLNDIESDIEDQESDDIDEDDDTKEEEEEVVEVSTDKKPKDKKKFYVDPKQFDDEIVNFYKTEIISNELADMISKISYKLSYASNFINYSYREEMVGDGIVRMMKALIAKKYDRERGTNPFSYFTRIAFNAFRNRIKKEKHIHETHEKYQEELKLLTSNYNNVIKNKNSGYSSRFN